MSPDEKVEMEMEPCRKPPHQPRTSARYPSARLWVSSRADCSLRIYLFTSVLSAPQKYRPPRAKTFCVLFPLPQTASCPAQRGLSGSTS